MKTSVIYELASVLWLHVRQLLMLKTLTSHDFDFFAARSRSRSNLSSQ